MAGSWRVTLTREMSEEARNRPEAVRTADQYQPAPVEKQIVIIFAGTNGFLDDLPVEECRPFEAELYRYLENARPEMLRKIATQKAFDDKGELRNELKAVLTEFKQRFLAERQKVAAD